MSNNLNPKPVPSSSGISDMQFEGGEKSAREIDKLEIIKLQTEIRYLKQQLDLTVQERDNHARDLREQDIRNRSVQDDTIKFETKVGALEKELQHLETDKHAIQDEAHRWKQNNFELESQLN